MSRLPRLSCLLAVAAGAVLLVPAEAGAMANPASVFCARMGGRSVIARLPSGDAVGLCYLAKDKIIEEWTLFRMFKGKLPSARNRLIRL